MILSSLVLRAAERNDILPQYLDDQFEMAPGLRIYRVAGPELSGGSYDLAFDGEGRLLVGDGTALRRLIDRDKDGVFDQFEVIATGLGPRGPQGLLVCGDRLYAVGGDGIQIYEGYSSNGPLIYRGRVGNKFNTGGDHDAHTIFRGMDGYLYFMSGNGAGNEDRRHITENTSPVLFEREASVFRISPDGQKWECVAAGGRNPPNLGMNYLGELFSFDSDMEWHVGLPWYRPVTLNHWIIGGDQGWEDVGAYPRYYIDCLPGVLEVGRGSPNWGVFYEHKQLPAKYHDAYLVCDYRWKRESDDQYASTGRLVAFFLKREGATWKASMEVLAKPRPGAKDASGKIINFALVDIEVAPDGSLFLSDHNQGIWRIIYDPEKRNSPGVAPAIVEPWPALPADSKRLFEEIIALPQPGSERSRLREETIRAGIGRTVEAKLQEAALNSRLPQQKRVRAVRLLSSNFSDLSESFLKRLAADKLPELRGQAAGLLGIRGTDGASPLLVKMLRDQDPFVRRRAAEALGRFGSSALPLELIDRLGDSDRIVRYTAMTTLAHRPTVEWLERALSKSNPQIQMRALVATLIRREPASDPVATRTVLSLLNATNLAREDRLDLLRILALFQKPIEANDEARRGVVEYLLSNFPERDRDIRWEQIRLLGAFRVSSAFGKLLSLLESEKDHVTQFHIAQAICRLPQGWRGAEEERLLTWILGTQTGWFADFEGKGVEFPDFWTTVLSDFGTHHPAKLLRDPSRIDFTSLLGGVVIELLTGSPEALLALYETNQKVQARVKILRAFQKTSNPTISGFLKKEYEHTPDTALRAALLVSLAAQRPELVNLPFLLEGLRHNDVNVVRACANALIRLQPEVSADLVNLLMSRLVERRDLFRAMEKALSALTKTERAGFERDADVNRRADDTLRAAGIAFWTRWYEMRFGRKFEPTVKAVAEEKSDEAIHNFILNSPVETDGAVRGVKIYERLLCNSCHGGGITPGQEGRFFGPDLAGVTRRLTRAEFADALVYPSKQVADRFKAIEVVLKQGGPLAGFITEQTDNAVVLVDREQVHRIQSQNIQKIIPQSTSLMPERLLNSLSWDEIKDLLAFLDKMGAAIEVKNGAK